MTLGLIRIRIPHPSRHAGHLRCALFRLHPALLAISAPLPQHPTDFGPAEATRKGRIAHADPILVFNAVRRPFLGPGRCGMKRVSRAASPAAAVQEHEAYAVLTSGPGSWGVMAH
jgi:hypothetical protein